MPKEDKVYRLAVGIFDEKKNETNWHDVEEFDDFDKAQKEFRKYVSEQLKYSDEEFDKVWKTPRLDIELLMGDTLLNWVGVYARGNKADVEDAWVNIGSGWLETETQDFVSAEELADKRVFKDKYGHVVTEDELYDEFKELKAEEPEKYNYSFEEYVDKVTGKNGSLTLVKMVTDAKKRDFAVFGINDKGFKKMLTHGFESWEEAQKWVDGYDGHFIDGNDEEWLLGVSEL